MNKDIYQKLLEMSKDKDYESNKMGTPLGSTGDERDKLNRNINKSLEEMLMKVAQGEEGNFKHKSAEDFSPEFVDEFLKKRKFKVLENMK